MPSEFHRQFHRELESRLNALEARSQRRELAEIQGTNFCSNDYLGLAGHPALRAAVERAVREAGRVGGTGSRLLSGHILRAVGFVGPDDPLHERVADHIPLVEVNEGNSFDPGKYGSGFHQTRDLSGRQVDLRNITGNNRFAVISDSREEHLHLLGRSVLGFIKNDKCVVQRPSAHESDWRDLDDSTLDMTIHTFHVVPGRNPSRSPASTAGRVNTIRLVLFSSNARTAMLTAKYVFPVPAGPMPKTMSCFSIASRYSFWFSVLGETLRFPA